MPELPKLSTFVKVLTFPETQFESLVRSTGFDIPKGPAQTLVDFMSGIEKGELGFPSLELPKIPGFGGLPKFEFPPIGGESEVESLGEATISETESIESPKLSSTERKFEVY